MSVAAIEGALAGKSLADDDITALADELAVPVQALFAHQTLPLFPPVDFRTATPSIGEFSKGTLKAISFVEKLSSTFSALGYDFNLDNTLRVVETDYSMRDAIKLAKDWRSRWGITDEQQIEWQDANKLYGSLRSFIENMGILVLHRQFRSDEAAGLYMNVADGPHAIVINTTYSSKARKLFTLAHEFCHVLIGAKGASNPSVLKNKIERFCNRFAACLLAPRHLIVSALEAFNYTPVADDNFIRLFAKKIGLSQEATYLRLVETDYLAAADYAAWKKKIVGVIPLGDQSDGQGGKGDPIQTKKTTYGSALLGLLKRAKALGDLDEIDIFRVTGLKPVYQTELIG